MNDGDVYVLDTRSIIYVWVGRNSNNIEKLQGAKVGVLDVAVRGAGYPLPVDPFTPGA